MVLGVVEHAWQIVLRSTVKLHNGRYGKIIKHQRHSQLVALMDICIRKKRHFLFLMVIVVAFYVLLPKKNAGQVGHRKTRQSANMDTPIMRKIHTMRKMALGIVAPVIEKN